MTVKKVKVKGCDCESAKWKRVLRVGKSVAVKMKYTAVKKVMEILFKKAVAERVCGEEDGVRVEKSVAVKMNCMAVKKVKWKYCLLNVCACVCMCV